MKFELPVSLANPQAISACISELLHAQEALRSHSLAKKTGASGRPVNTIHLSQAAGELLAGIATPGRPTLSELSEAVSYLQQLQQQTPVVSITLAAEPSEDKKTSLIQWFQQLSGQVVLCKFITDASIAGGVVIRTPQRMYDYSFATLLRTQTDTLRKELSRG